MKYLESDVTWYKNYTTRMCVYTLWTLVTVREGVWRIPRWSLSVSSAVRVMVDGSAVSGSPNNSENQWPPNITWHKKKEGHPLHRTHFGQMGTALSCTKCSQVWFRVREFRGTETRGHAMTGNGTPLKTSVFLPKKESSNLLCHNCPTHLTRQ